MKRLSVCIVVAIPLMALAVDSGLFASLDLPATPIRGSSRAFAQMGDVSTKEAFEAAKSLDTLEAWDAFLKSYPTGFYGDLGRAYVKKLRDAGATATPVPRGDPAASPPQSAADSAAPGAAAAAEPTADATPPSDLAPTDR